MRKIGFVLALMVLLAGVPVQAQKQMPRPRISPPAPEPTKIVLQDDASSGYLAFDPVTGAYDCNICEYGFVLSGTGTVRVDGCTVFFSDIQGGYRVFATLDMCEHSAKAEVEVYSLTFLRYDIEPIVESWGDADMRDSAAECAGQRARK